MKRKFLSVSFLSTLGWLIPFAGFAATGASPGALVLPVCIKTGNCQLNDIVQTGVNFAQFIMGISSAMFLVVFIYGGFMYLTSFGEKGRVEKGKTAIKGAATGLIFVLGAWTIVQAIIKGMKG